ncbi:hypothetical protein BX616_005768 [Lobosporangium transversale]|uniref:Glutathione S-transferase n=1 Tax=Lobosporangium transversale TaxID=64571 RepID=A0A1Y2GUM6_9FUNG|nr:glutathione S-transferase [Lobosporangium transversale]KAF9915600.1 hypothetical protein BX616_005768 [Lobosporangium transversale]ORZ24764.1 glutathione S-transferase [Lobosporangium transversale]|eukprot:XP_021883745.1 glutathione S-transferase [Lobosporangium transversale]
MVHEFFNPAQAAAFDELSQKKDTTFEVRYFNVHGLATAIRLILAAAGAKFTNIFPGDNWAEEKPKAPFGVMPLLKEISADGKTSLQIAESDSIERYLARKFGFYGSNLFEETAINTFVSQLMDVNSKIFVRYFAVKDDKELQEKNRKELVAGPIANWIKYNEQHLKDNGTNGHFVGNKLSLADFRAYFFICLLEMITAEEGLISPEKTPGILKVKEVIDSDPSIKAWKATEDYKVLSENNARMLGFP